MRKIAGIMLSILLLVPALASAWTLQGAVQGPNGLGSISINTSPAKNISIGSGYAYVASGTDAIVTFTGPVSKVVVDGVALSATTTPTLAATITAGSYTVANTGSSHSIFVTFAVPTYTVTAITPRPAGGSVTMQQTAPFVSGISQTSLTGIKPGATMKVTAVPSFDQKVTGITYGTTTVPFTDGAGVAKSTTFTVNASQTVTATFSKVANYNIVLKAPSAAATGSAISVDAANTTSNDTALKFAFAVTGPTSFTQDVSATPTFSFTPTLPGSYIVTLTMTSANSANGFTGLNTKTATIAVESAVASANNACTTCHSGNSTTLITAYNASAHKTTNSCQGCHTAKPHDVALPTAAVCESCHKATLSTTTHPVALTETKCITCHDPHNPAAGIANLGTAPAHPAVTLYTFEEIGMQMAGGAKVPVQVDANGKGMPYSPKQTCGTSGCHIKNGVDYTYDKISDHAFHSNQGRSEYQDSSDGKFNATKNKPWTQSTAMVGKW